MITLSINVKKLDKLRFIEGEKGTYCNLVLFETPNSAYGDYMVKQDLSKEDREAHKDTPIIGNAKIFVRKEVLETPAATPDPAFPARPPKEQAEPDDEPLPF